MGGDAVKASINYTNVQSFLGPNEYGGIENEGKGIDIRGRRDSGRRDLSAAESKR